MGAAAIKTPDLSFARRTHVDALCTYCHSVLSGEDELCFECRTPRPSAGWRRLDSVLDAWLGQTIFDDLLVTRRLGSGSTAVVYRARSISTCRDVALKVIDLERPGSTFQENIEGARREVRIASHLSNPHVVHIHEMKEAHRAGIVHRDIKPENLLVQTAADGSDFLRISDFGIASPATTIDRDQGFVGTPLWASPEQIAGRAVDARSDIYSIGALLYYLLTGQAPFNQGNYITIMESHLNVTAPPLREAGVRLFSPELEDVVRMLLSKTPGDRPSDLLELRALLDELEKISGWADTVEIGAGDGGLLEDSETIQVL